MIRRPSPALQRERLRAPHAVSILAVTGVVAVWMVVVLLASAVRAPWPVRRAAIVLHLASLVIGFGSALISEVWGVLWVSGKRSLRETVLVSSTLHPLVWVGLAGLAATGLVLHPNLALPRTQLKLVCTLIIGINGLWLGALSRRMADQPDGRPAEMDGPLLKRMMIACGVSQGAWWVATIVGVLATTSATR